MKRYNTWSFNMTHLRGGMLFMFVNSKQGSFGYRSNSKYNRIKNIKKGNLLTMLMIILFQHDGDILSKLYKRTKERF